MWILEFNGTLMWLHGDKCYTVGRQDTDVIVQNDPTISRKHITLEVGVLVNGTQTTTTSGMAGMTTTDMITQHTNDDDKQVSPSHLQTNSVTKTLLTNQTVTPPLPPQRERTSLLQITDHSKFGTTVTIGEQTTKLAKEAVFTIPATCKKFVIVLGSHNLMFTAKWEPMSVSVCQVDVEYATKLEHALGKCGCVIVDDVKEASMVVTTTIAPTAAVISALCLGLPIVGPKYFDTILNRTSPRQMLPDAASKAFLPMALDPFWEESFPAIMKKMGGTGAPVECFLPMTNRKKLFSSIVFVTIQKELYDELAGFLPSADGHLQFDGTLEAVNANLSTFVTRHHAHLILFTDSIPLPISQAQFDALSTICKLNCLNYSRVLECIISAEPLQIPHFPSLEDATKCAGSIVFDKIDKQRNSGRKTDRLLFEEEEEGNAVGESRKDQLTDRDGLNSPVRKSRRVVDCSVDGWVSRDQLRGVSGIAHNGVDGPAEEAEEHVHGAQEKHGGTAKDDEKVDLVVIDAGLVMVKPLVLPPYPCFVPYKRHGGSTGATVAVGCQKVFKKQKIAKTTEVYHDFELVQNKARSVFAGIDGENIIPEVVGPIERTRTDLFNEFDARVHNRTAPKRPPRAPAGGKAKTRAPRGKKSAPVVPVVAERPAGPAQIVANDIADISSGSGAGGGSGGFFDIENMLF